MRIAIATAVYHPMINGVAMFSYNLARGLAARGHEVLVLCPSQKGVEFSRREEGVLVQYVAAREFKMYPDQIHEARKVPWGEKMLGGAEKLAKRVGGDGKFGWWPQKYEHGLRVAIWPRRAVFEALDDFRPEVVHIQVADMIGMAAESWARRNGVPVVATEHNQAEVLIEPLGLPEFLARPAERFLEAYFRRRLNRSDFATMPTREAILNLVGGKDLVSDGRRGRALLRGILRRQRIRTPIAAVSNGVDLSRFVPGKAKAEIYRKYGIEKGVPTVLYVGRVDPEKKVEVLIRALLQVNGDAHLVIVGDGVERKGLEKLARELGIDERVRFLGRVVGGDLAELYKAGDVFATASEIETQGIVLIEAAAAGLPLIAVDKGAVSEICIDGEDGFLCRPGDVKGIAAAMEKILADEKLRKKMSQRAVVEAKKHDLEQTLGRFENIYARMMKRRLSRKDRKMAP